MAKIIGTLLTIISLPVTFVGMICYFTMTAFMIGWDVSASVVEESREEQRRKKQGY